MQRHARILLDRALVAGLALVPLACLDGDVEDQVATQQQEIASVMGGMEWSIDAPWRMEPPYGPVPITVTFHDGSEQKDPELALELRRFCGVSVAEIPSPEPSSLIVSTYVPIQFHEIEAAGRWPSSDDGPAFHHLVRRWRYDSPEPVLDIGASAEWNGTFLYTPRAPGAATAGRDLELQVVAWVSESGTCPPSLPSTIHDVFSGSPQGVVRRYISTLRVRYGDPLPRFDTRWVYGDLHYHAQGTDNEGESALSYRAVIQAMKAMGLDFVFATDHASDSDQTTDIDAMFVKLPDWVPEWIEDAILDRMGNPAAPIESSIDAARDMNPRRFAYLRNWLNRQWTGVNDEILLTPGQRTPQVFLGGEVDVVPEISEAERVARWFPYGNGRKYLWAAACTDLPDIFANFEYEICSSSDVLVDEAAEGNRWLLRDIQGMGQTTFFARQHVLHLPTDPLRDDAFVSSGTSRYGGASRRLKNVLAADYNTGRKGYMFLAHPVSAASGKGYSRLGPDIVPFSDVQLATAFDSPYVLGLQVWNEDARLETLATDNAVYPMNPIYAWEFIAMFDFFQWRRQKDDAQLASLYQGAAVWDRMLLWGINSSRTAALAWLPAGQPRRVLMAGGSDAHGDLGFRREGSITGWSSATDTALGKPRNLVFVGATRPEQVPAVNGQSATSTVGQAQVVEALRTGQFSVTDGPAVRIAIDRNGNGVIDDTDVPMGGVADVTASASGSIPLVVEWRSTREFGPVTQVDLVVGAYASTHAEGVLYAPLNHGVRSAADPSGALRHTYLDSAGGAHGELADGYLLDPNGRLRVTFTPTKESLTATVLTGTRTVFLSRADYAVFARSCTSRTVWETPEGGIKPIATTVEECAASRVTAPQRLFVRAVARSTTSELLAYDTTRAIQRLAYTNPIWIRVQ